MLHFCFSHATSRALLSVFSCNFWCSTFVFLVQLLVPFLVLYFRFSRATSGALPRALLSVFSCNFWCPFSCSTFGFLVQLLVPFLVLYFRFSRATSGALPRAISCATVTENFQKKGEKNLCKSFPFVLIARAKLPFGLQPLAQIGDHAWKIAPSSHFPSPSFSRKLLLNLCACHFPSPSFSRLILFNL